MSTQTEAANRGPLFAYVGTWEGNKGDDIAPSDNRIGIENNKFKERLILEDAGVVQNHEQNLYALRYSLVAWRLGETAAFHEERGYFIWDAATKHFSRCFVIPRGISVIAGAEVEPNSTKFTLKSEAGSCTYGICSNPFLDAEFKIVSFTVSMNLLDGKSISYEQDTVLKLKGRTDLFHHKDRNTLNRVV